MDSTRLERIEAKLDDISEHLSSIDSTLAAQHVSIAEHVRRTNLLEKELAPVSKHVSRVEGALKLITGASVIAAFIELFLHK